MTVSVLLFGVLKAAANAAVIDVEATTAGEVQARALVRCGFEGLSGTRVWVNGDAVNDAYVICDGDEVAVLPPFSGG